MKKQQNLNRINNIIIFPFMVIIFTYFFYNSNKLKKEAKKNEYHGIISTITKGLKGIYKISIVSNDSLWIIKYSPGDKNLEISIGDSIYKHKNSSSVFIKLKVDKTIIVRNNVTWSIIKYPTGTGLP